MLYAIKLTLPHKASNAKPRRSNQYSVGTFGPHAFNSFKSRALRRCIRRRHISAARYKASHRKSMSERGAASGPG
jgi:hypothetical protein